MGAWSLILFALPNSWHGVSVDSTVFRFMPDIGRKST